MLAENLEFFSSSPFPFLTFLSIAVAQSIVTTKNWKKLKNWSSFLPRTLKKLVIDIHYLDLARSRRRDCKLIEGDAIKYIDFKIPNDPTDSETWWSEFPRGLNSLIVNAVYAFDEEKLKALTATCRELQTINIRMETFRGDCLAHLLPYLPRTATDVSLLVIRTEEKHHSTRYKLQKHFRAYFKALGHQLPENLSDLSLGHRCMYTLCSQLTLIYHPVTGEAIRFTRYGHSKYDSYYLQDAEIEFSSESERGSDRDW